MFRATACALFLLTAIVAFTGGRLNAQIPCVDSAHCETAPYKHLPQYGKDFVDCSAAAVSSYNQPSISEISSNECVVEGCVGQNYFQSPDEVARSHWFVRLGVGVLLFGESATLRINDAVVPGAGLNINDETTFAFDIGYQLSPHWSATFSCGVPPRLDLDGTGTLEGASYGTTLFAPVALTLQRHFYVTPKTSIYLGGGINYTAQYESKDGLIENLDIENDAAVVLQLGTERRINDRISLFADAKKVFYRTQAFGNVGPAPVRADVTVNPTVLVFGLKYNF